MEDAKETTQFDQILSQEVYSGLVLHGLWFHLYIHIEVLKLSSCIVVACLEYHKCREFLWGTVVWEFAYWEKHLGRESSVYTQGESDSNIVEGKIDKEIEQKCKGGPDGEGGSSKKQKKIKEDPPRVATILGFNERVTL